MAQKNDIENSGEELRTAIKHFNENIKKLKSKEAMEVEACANHSALKTISLSNPLQVGAQGTPSDCLPMAKLKCAKHITPSDVELNQTSVC